MKNVYSSGFTDSCFKKVIDNVLTEFPVTVIAKKRLVILPLPFLGDMSLELRTKRRKLSPDFFEKPKKIVKPIVF